MNRAKIIIIATLLAVLGALLPISATLYLSWQRATDIESERLLSFAQRGIERARISLGDAGKSTAGRAGIEQSTLFDHAYPADAPD